LDDNVEDIEFDLDEEDGSDNNDAEEVTATQAALDDNVEDIEFDLDEEDGSDNNEAEVDVIDVIESDAGVDDDDDDDDDDGIGV